MEIEGQLPAVKESDKIALPLRAVTEDYFKLMNLPMLGGREFRSSDEGKTVNVAIVNQAFADRYFPHGNAIGRKIWLGGRDQPGMEIVGEVSNGRTDDLTQAATPEVYLSLWQASAFSKHLVFARCPTHGQLWLQCSGSCAQWILRRPSKILRP